MSAEKHQRVFPHDAAFVPKPLRAGERIRCDDVHEFGVIDIVAAFHYILFEACNTVFDAVSLLEPVARSGHFGSRDERIAPGHRHLFQNDNVRARFFRFDCGCKSRTSRTDDDDVVRFRFFLFRFCFRRCGSFFIRFEFSARLCDRRIHGRKKAFRSERTAGNRIDRRTVRFYYRRFKRIHRFVEARRFFV